MKCEVGSEKLESLPSWCSAVPGVVLLLICGAVLGLSGCSVFGSPTPRDDASISRSGMDGSGRLAPVDVMVFSGQWLDGEFRARVEEHFWNPAEIGPEGAKADYLKSRVVDLDRKTATDGARDVAIERAHATNFMASEFLAMVTAAAPVVTSALVALNKIQQENQTLRTLAGFDKDVSIAEIESRHHGHHEAPE